MILKKDDKLNRIPILDLKRQIIRLYARIKQKTRITIHLSEIIKHFVVFDQLI